MVSYMKCKYSFLALYLNVKYVVLFHATVKRKYKVNWTGSFVITQYLCEYKINRLPIEITIKSAYSEYVRSLYECIELDIET